MTEVAGGAYAQAPQPVPQLWLPERESATRGWNAVLVRGGDLLPGEAVGFLLAFQVTLLHLLFQENLFGLGSPYSGHTYWVPRWS